MQTLPVGPSVSAGLVSGVEVRENRCVGCGLERVRACGKGLPMGGNTAQLRDVSPFLIPEWGPWFVMRARGPLGRPADPSHSDHRALLAAPERDTPGCRVGLTSSKTAGRTHDPQKVPFPDTL